MLRYKSSKLNFVLLNKPKSLDNLPVKLDGQYISFLLRKGLDTVESLSVEGKGSKTLGKIFLVL